MGIMTRGRLSAGLLGLATVALVSCSSNSPDGLDFPLGGDDEKSDIFLYIVMLMPLAGALLGLLSWFVRRR